jgi:hypothetical protein
MKLEANSDNMKLIPENDIEASFILILQRNFEIFVSDGGIIEDGKLYPRLTIGWKRK